jgi:hypothetical protein
MIGKCQIHTAQKVVSWKITVNVQLLVPQNLLKIFINMVGSEACYPDPEEIKEVPIIPIVFY